MMKKFKKFIAIMLTFVFVLSLVPFSASAAERESIYITGENKIAGYMSGKQSTVIPTNADGEQRLRTHATNTSNVYITYLQYYISNDNIPYLNVDGATVDFSIQHSSVVITRSYDLYLLKGNYVNVSDNGTVESLLTMKYAYDNGIVDKKYQLITENNDKLIYVDTFDGADTQLHTYTVNIDDFKEVLKDTNWVTFILKPNYSEQLYRVSGNNENTKLTISYDPDKVAGDDDALASIGTHELTVDKDSGTATANISVTNGTGEDVTYNLYIVVYNDGEMSKIVADTLTVTAGNEGSKEFSCAEEITTGSKVKFLVWEADGITPAIASIEK